MRQKRFVIAGKTNKVHRSISIKKNETISCPAVSSNRYNYHALDQDEAIRKATKKRAALENRCSAFSAEPDYIFLLHLVQKIIYK